MRRFARCRRLGPPGRRTTEFPPTPRRAKAGSFRLEPLVALAAHALGDEVILFRELGSALVGEGSLRRGVEAPCLRTRRAADHCRPHRAPAPALPPLHLLVGREL